MQHFSFTYKREYLTLRCLFTWQSKEELLDSKFCTVDSLGYLIANKEDCVIIAGDKDTFNQDDMFGRSQVIPKGIVLDIQYLSKNEDNN
jgi:hypothetical protein